MTAAFTDKVALQEILADHMNAVQDGLMEIAYNVKAPNFGAVGDGVTDDTDAVRACVAAAILAERPVYVPPGTYLITDQITLNSGVILFGAGDTSVLKVGASMAGKSGNAFIYAAGTSDYTAGVALTANALRGAFSVDLPTGQGANWAKDDWIVFESLGIYTVGSTDVHPKEVHRIWAVVGDTIYLDNPLVWDYLTADTAKFYPLVPKENIAIRDLKIISDDGLTYLGYSIRLDHTVHARLDNLTIEGTGGGIAFYGTHHSYLNNYRVHGLPNGREANTLTSYGYGFFLDDASSYCTISNMTGGDCRHFTSTVYEQRSGGHNYGGPQHCKFSNCFGYGEISGLPIFDTHAGGFDIVFENCIAYGAKSDGTFTTGGGTSSHGFQIRSAYTKLVGCRIFMSGFGRGVAFYDTAEYGEVSGGEIAYCTLNGISVGPNCFIHDVHIHDNAQQGIAVGQGINDWVVQGCWIHDNGGSYAGIEIQASAGVATTGWYVLRNIIPSGGANHAVTFTNTNVSGVIEDNKFTGFSGANAISGPPSSGVSIKNNNGYVTEKWGATSVADGGTVSHGLVGTPTAVTVTPSTSGEFVSVTALGSSTFTVAIKKHDNSAGTTQTVYWRAVKVME